MSKPNVLLLNPVAWYNSVSLTSLGLLSCGAMVRDECDLHHLDGNINGLTVKNFIKKIPVKPDVVASTPTGW